MHSKYSLNCVKILSCWKENSLEIYLLNTHICIIYILCDCVSFLIECVYLWSWRGFSFTVDVDNSMADQYGYHSHSHSYKLDPPSSTSKCLYSPFQEMGINDDFHKKAILVCVEELCGRLTDSVSTVHLYLSFSFFKIKCHLYSYSYHLDQHHRQCCSHHDYVISTLHSYLELFKFDFLMWTRESAVKKTHF